jgi:hypothetical protein
MKTSSLFRFTNDCCFMSAVNNQGSEQARDPRLQNQFRLMSLARSNRISRRPTSPDDLLLPDSTILFTIHYQWLHWFHCCRRISNHNQPITVLPTNEDSKPF